jgi:hypothetical protein
MFTTRTTDIYHALYDFDIAHIVHAMHIVMILLGGSKEKKWFAPSTDAEPVNKRIAQLHNLNGWETWLPFFVKYTSGAVSTYDGPRDVKVLLFMW